MSFIYMLARKWVAWLLPTLLLGCAAYYLVRAPYVWESSELDEPLIAVRVPTSQTSLTLELGSRVDDDIGFHVATSPEAGRRFLQYALRGDAPGLVSCTGDEGARVKLDWQHQTPACVQQWWVSCSRAGRRLTIELDRVAPTTAQATARAPERDGAKNVGEAAATEPAAGGGGETPPPDSTGGQKTCGGGRARWATLYLVPHEEREGILAPARVLWTKVDGVEGEECNDANGACRAAWLTPGLTLLRDNDPQRWIKGFAESFVQYAAPGAILAMILVDIVLALLLALLLVAFVWPKPWLSRIYLVIRDRTHEEGEVATFVHAADAALGLRAVLDFLRVAGPALGFFLTVVALLLAMRAEVFGAGVTAFTKELSLALTSTLLGLGMRLFADASARLVDYQLHLEAEGQSGLLRSKRAR